MAKQKKRAIKTKKKSNPAAKRAKIKIAKTKSKQKPSRQLAAVKSKAPAQKRAPVPALSDIGLKILDESHPICLRDLDSNVLYRNAAHRQQIDAAEQEPDAPRIQEIISQLEVLKRPVQYDLRLRLNGKPLLFRALHRIQKIKQGFAPVVVSQFWDTSPEEQVKSRLILTQSRLDDVIRLSSDWVWETDAQLRLVTASPRIAEVTGIPARALMGRQIFSLGALSGQAAGGIPKEVERLVPFRNIEFRVPSPSGNEHIVLLSGMPIFSREEGKFLGYRGTAQDVTLLKQREESLIEARNAADAANKTKSEFFAKMSHELRTPLNAIIGFSDVMSKESLGKLGAPQYKTYVEDIHDSAAHLLNVINDILDVSKAEAGKLELIEQNVSMAALAQSVVRMLAENAEKNGVALSSIDVSPSLVLRGDHKKLKQILINLVSNAVKFTLPGGAVSVSAYAEKSNGAVILVRDNGIGMKREDIPKALTPFAQIDNNLTRKHDGTGLGLPLCAALAELHGGKLSIESEPGKGTTVRVTLPQERVVGN